jgi:hypothetical protein
MVFAKGFIRQFKMSFTLQRLEKKVYISLEELQADVEKWLMEYNEERTHSGKYCFEKTPMQTFAKSKHLAQEKMLDRLNLTPTETVK